MYGNVSPTSVPRNHDFPYVSMNGQSSAHFGDVYYLAQDHSTQAQQAELKRNELLTALAFEGMNARHMQLAQISVESLEWIWHKTEKKGPGFIEWLASGETTFWITGKPASGKSTLMDFLATSNDCTNILERHSGHKWLTLRFFFDFRAGSQTANSLEGLLRSFLFQLVKNSTAARVVQNDPIGRDLHIKHNDMNLNALYCLIKTAVEAVSDTHHIFALIDGLDEYSGNYIHLNRMIERLVQSGINKICLASRPEHLLHQFLVGKPHFRMQDHNYETIKACATRAIEQVSTMVELPMDKQALIGEIVSSSDGVILWTRIATETLLESLLGGDTEEELWEKLREFPTELNEAYERLLGGVSGSRRLETALILHLIRTASHPLSPRDLLCALVFLRDIDLLPDWPRHTIDECTFLLRLRARTGSMVDIVHSQTTPADSIRHWDSSRISLFHKTLNDYLTASNHIYDVLSAASIPIQPDQLWLKSFAQCVLKYDFPQNSLSNIWDRYEQDPEFYKPTFSWEESSNPLFQDEKALKMVRIMSSNDSVDSGMAFLDCAIANLPTYLTLNPPCTAFEQSLYQQALGSLNMTLHFVTDRLRNSLGEHLACNCSEWCNMQAFYSRETLFALSSKQRAILFAILHSSLQNAKSWLLEENTMLDQSFGREILKSVIPLRNKLGITDKSRKNEIMSLARTVAQFADDEILTPLIPRETSMLPGWEKETFSIELLKLLAPHLAANSGDRKLTRIWQRDHMLNSITSEGYNLYLPWTADSDPHQYRNWLREHQAEKLEMIIASGLDMNAPCCRFGPPLHTAVEVYLLHENWTTTTRAAIEEIQILLYKGADPLILFKGLTVQDLARERLQQVRASTYVPVTGKGIFHLNKWRAANQLESIIRYLEDPTTW